MTKQAKPENASWLSPYIMVKDVDRSADFYEKAFGMKLGEKMPGEDGSTIHAGLNYQGQVVMIGKAGAGNHFAPPNEKGADLPMFLYLYCDNVDDFFKKATEQGADGVTSPEDMPWGDRMCRLKDPDGYVWSFGTHLG